MTVAEPLAVPPPASTPWVPVGPAAASTFDTLPIGATISYSGKTIPGGYVLADGTRYTQTQFPQAYAYAGQEVAAGNPLWTQRTSDTTFTVPDLRDRFLFNASTAIPFGQSGGEKTHTLVNGEMPTHSHGGRVLDTGGTWEPMATGASPPAGAVGWYNRGGSGSGVLTIPNDGGSGAHNTMPPYVAIAQIVKVQPVASPYPSPVVNGQFVKGVGGAAVWQPIARADLNGAISPGVGDSAGNAVQVADLNNATSVGWYQGRVDSNTANRPANVWCSVQTVNLDTGTALRQFAYEHGSQRAWMRYYPPWSAWQQIWPNAGAARLAGQVAGNGSIAWGFPAGAFTVSHPGAGNYTITSVGGFSTPYGVILATIIGQSYVIGAAQGSPTTWNVYVTTPSAWADVGFYFAIYDVTTLG